MYQSTKTFGHELGLSCAFRQWRANSHCKKLHGYALSFKFTFGAETLDDKNWVVDFGDLKTLKEALENKFDHKVAVANDDPLLHMYLDMMQYGAMDIVILDKVGCEAFARIGFILANEFLHNKRYTPRVTLLSCECSEHGANSAVYTGENE